VVEVMMMMIMMTMIMMTQVADKYFDVRGTGRTKWRTLLDAESQRHVKKMPSVAVSGSNGVVT
jgi:hypothetical protein